MVLVVPVNVWQSVSFRKKKQFLSVLRPTYQNPGESMKTKDKRKARKRSSLAVKNRKSRVFTVGGEEGGTR